jgi:hypothetical protein
MSFADFQQFMSRSRPIAGDVDLLCLDEAFALHFANWATIQQANKMIEDFCRTQDHVQFIDIRPAMLDAQGRPRRELFRFDGLHMNAQGYALWTAIIKPILLSRFGSGSL